MAWAGRDANFLTSVMLSSHLISCRSRHEIRKAIVAALNGFGFSHRRLNAAIERNLRVNDGALIQAPRAAIQSPSEYQTWVYPASVKVDRLNSTYMRRFLDLAADRRIPVFWVLTPVSAQVQNQAAEAGTIGPNELFLRRMLVRYPGVTIVDGRRSAYPDPAFDDSIHLARDGAAVFSADLADAMALALGGAPTGDRWVTLQAFRDRPIGARFEDMGESLTASAAAGRVLR